jgi:plastocyanin
MERYRFLFVFLVAAVPLQIHAASIRAKVSAADGTPVENAVIVAYPLSGSAPVDNSKLRIIDQINKEFVPHVTTVTTGTSIQFPNKDNIRHHVYSISDPKNFELPLYEGIPANPVKFDKPGIVVLGCNIHDWMRGYIYIVESPYFGKSGENGFAEIELPAGEYRVELWHPRLSDPDNLQTQQLNISDSNPGSLSYTVNLKPALRIRRAPKARRRGY